ncbi:MAG: MaoC/PaaZ C-terminal domain-containing protein [Myxococcota bacterium]
MRLFPGQKLELTRTFTQEDFDRFARLSGDDNPIHVDPEFAKRTRFGRTLCHGMLLFSTIDGAIRRGLAELEPVVEGIELMFPGPTYVGDTMKIQVEVVSTSPETQRAQLAASIIAPDGQPGCVAQAKVFLRRAS